MMIHTWTYQSKKETFFVFFLRHLRYSSSPPTNKMMPPVMAMRDLRSLSSPAQVVHFIPMQATPRPAMDTMMPTIINARVAWREPGDRQVNAKEENVFGEKKITYVITKLTETTLCTWFYWSCDESRGQPVARRWAAHKQQTTTQSLISTAAFWEVEPRSERPLCVSWHPIKQSQPFISPLPPSTENQSVPVQAVPALPQQRELLQQ